RDDPRARPWDRPERAQLRGDRRAGGSAPVARRRDREEPEEHPVITLVVGRTWDGELLPEAARAALRIGYDGDDLVIEVEAPFAGDPAPSSAPGPTDRLWEHEVVE